MQQPTSKTLSFVSFGDLSHDAHVDIVAKEAIIKVLTVCMVIDDDFVECCVMLLDETIGMVAVVVDERRQRQRMTHK